MLSNLVFSLANIAPYISFNYKLKAVQPCPWLMRFATWMSILHLSFSPSWPVIRLKLRDYQAKFGHWKRSVIAELGNGDKRNNECFIISYCSLYVFPFRTNRASIISLQLLIRFLKKVPPFISSVSKSQISFSAFSFFREWEKESRKNREANYLVDPILKQWITNRSNMCIQESIVGREVGGIGIVEENCRELAPCRVVK